jgi:hypothetical protein
MVAGCTARRENRVTNVKLLCPDEDERILHVVFVASAQRDLLLANIKWRRRAG